jgi:hypothetical protein
MPGPVVKMIELRPALEHAGLMLARMGKPAISFTIVETTIFSPGAYDDGLMSITLGWDILRSDMHSRNYVQPAAQGSSY